MKIWSMLGLVLTLFWASSVWADAPTSIPVQGQLTSADGTPINDVFAVTFTIYTDENRTTTLWTEELPVNFVNGYFTAYLGSSSVIDLVIFRDNNTPYLGVKVADDTEMTPFALSTAPFAGFAQYAGHAGDLTDAAKLQIVDAVAIQLENDSKVHVKYTDADAVAAVSTALAADPSFTGAVGAALAPVAASGDYNDLTNTPAYQLGDRLLFAQDAEIIRREDNAGVGFVTMNTTSAVLGGDVRIGFEAFIQSGNDYWAWQIMVDGNPVATGAFTVGLHSTNTSSVHASRRYQIDISGVSPGSRIELQMKASNASGNGVGTDDGQHLHMKRFRVYANQPSSEGGTYTAATWRGRMTQASATALVASNTGFVQFEAVEDGNSDVFEVVTTGNGGIRFNKAGHIMWQHDQDIITGSAGSYAYFRSQVTNKVSNYTLLRPTSGLWNTLSNSGVAQVTPGDILEMEMVCSSCDITSLDASSWSNMSIFWMGHLDP